MFKTRSVLEIMVMSFTFVVVFAISGLSVMILIVEVKNPEADTGLIANTLMSLVSGILGALLGLIAGRTDTLRKKPDDAGVDDLIPPGE